MEGKIRAAYQKIEGSRCVLYVWNPILATWSKREERPYPFFNGAPFGAWGYQRLDETTGRWHRDFNAKLHDLAEKPALQMGD